MIKIDPNTLYSFNEIKLMLNKLGVKQPEKLLQKLEIKRVARNVVFGFEFIQAWEEASNGKFGR